MSHHAFLTALVVFVGAIDIEELEASVLWSLAVSTNWVSVSFFVLMSLACSPLNSWIWDSSATMSGVRSVPYLLIKS